MFSHSHTHTHTQVALTCKCKFISSYVMHAYSISAIHHPIKNQKEGNINKILLNLVEGMSDELFRKVKNNKELVAI